MKHAYKYKKFTPRVWEMIQRANAVLDEYAAQGYVLTLRQLYYQFVARDWIPNSVKSYKILGAAVGNARLAGCIDWNMIEDRTRRLSALQHFGGAQDALNKLAGWYHVDMWENQRFRPEVWVEKDALAGVLSRVCQDNDVPWFSCRGYTSLSEMWSASERLKGWIDGGQSPYILHFGDHDPSGIDMSRDIVDRIRDTFMSDCEFKRVALNMDQIERLHPPPNPAKVTDSRYKAYLRRFGDESWELDALEPTEFKTLIEGELAKIRDEKAWKADELEKESVRSKLVEVSERWEDVGRIGDLEIKLRRAERQLAALKNGKAKRKRKR